MSDPIALSTTHHTLIEEARLRADRRLMPPERVRGRARRLLAEKLIALGLAKEAEGREAVWWTDPERGEIGLQLADDGIDGTHATTATEGADAETPTGSSVGAASASRPTEPQAWTKIARVLALLRRPEGADLQALVAATDWLPHTARAALTGLRHKGHAIDTRKEDGRTVYRVLASAASAADVGEERAPPSSSASN